MLTYIKLTLGYLKGLFFKIVTKEVVDEVEEVKEKIETNSKEVIKQEVQKLIESKTDGITSDIALVMLEAITKSELNKVTSGMVSKAISTLKKEIE
jgi:hypothetical protein